MTCIQNVVLLGGPANIPGLEQRVVEELTALRPFGTSLRVMTAQDPAVTSWRGGSTFAASPLFQQTCITRAEYQEKGPGYLKEHQFGNLYVPTPQQPTQPTNGAS